MKNKVSKSILNLVMTALMASLCCVATMIIKIPVPATGGYLNLGDGFVILSAWMLGPLWGTLAAGLGSALADILSGYVVYAPVTFVIKALMAIAVWAVLRLLIKFYAKKAIFAFITLLLAGILAEVIMVGGYFVCEAFLLGYGMGAAASVIPNMIQGGAGIVTGTLLVSLLSRTKIKERFLS